VLPAATQAEILRLHYAERWAGSRIARHLGVNRKSVRKVLRRRSVALAPAPPRPRMTCLSPFRPRIQALLAEALVERFDADWWRNPRAGPWITAELFSHGQRELAEEQARRVAGRSPSFAPLVRAIEGMLT